MYLKINCVDPFDNEMVEICSFHGIRYDKLNRSVVLSTEHTNHDYVIPLEEDGYHMLVVELERAIAKGCSIVALENGKVFRCRRGEKRRTEYQSHIRVMEYDPEKSGEQKDN